MLYDDRAGKVSPGVKFKDAELIGVPTIVTVGRGLADGTVEVRDRATGEREEVAVDARRRARRRARPGLTRRPVAVGRPRVGASTSPSIRPDADPAEADWWDTVAGRPALRRRWAS